MERVVVIEVGDQQGKVIERFRATHFPVRIGRAYDNDLIVGDPYVCPHHCEVTLGAAGEVVVNDLSSVNGTFALKQEKRSGQILVEPDSRLRIGHTMLHFKFPDQPVEATRIDTAHAARRTWPPQSLMLNLVVLLLGALAMTLWDYLDSYTAFDYGRYFFGQQIPALIAVAGWAAIWSIVSRITAHRFAFLHHATLVVSIILVMALGDYLLELLKFGFASYWPFEILNMGIVTAAIALLLYWHLRICTEQQGRRLMFITSVIAVVFVGLIQVNQYLDGQEFRSAPRYSTSLKPPAFQMVNSKSIEEFLHDSTRLRRQIEREVAAQQPAVEVQAMAESRPEK